GRRASRPIRYSRPSQLFEPAHIGVPRTVGVRTDVRKPRRRFSRGSPTSSSPFGHRASEIRTAEHFAVSTREQGGQFLPDDVVADEMHGAIGCEHARAAVVEAIDIILVGTIHGTLSGGEPNIAGRWGEIAALRRESIARIGPAAARDESPRARPIVVDIIT